MPLHNLQLLLRPTPGGLQDHHCFLSTQADLSLRSELFSDLVIVTPDGPVSCHQSLLAPLSPLLRSLLSSYPPFPGLVHTVVIPIKILTVKNILQIIYTGMVSVRNRTDMEAVLTGLQVLGIHLPGLECYQSAGQTYTARGSTQPRSSRALDFSLPRVRKGVPENNNSVRMNNIPLPFSALSVPQSSSSLHRSIVQLPSYGQVFQDVKPNILSSLLPAPPLGLVDLQTQLASQLLPLAIDESVQCNVAGCRIQVSLQSLVEHFKGHQEHQFEGFKCDECNEGFKHKKALEIHRIRDHDHFIENPLFNEAIANDPERELDDELCDNYTAIEGNPRKSKKSSFQSATDNEGPPPLVSTVPQTPLLCTLCKVPLPTEWYRHPRRHKCPHATPRSVLITSGGEQTQCSLCSTPVPSTWHKPPSRHSCPSVTLSSSTPDQDLPAMSTKSQATTSSAKKRSRSASSNVSRKKVSQFSCENCTVTFSSLLSLRTHYTVSHYWDRISAKFSSWGPRCYICLRAFPSSNHLVRHMGNFHSYVDQCLVEDGMHFISMETTIKLLSLECGLCGDVKATSAELKNHLSYVHFSKELEREFPGDHPVHKNKRCDRCGKVFNSSSARIKHVGSFHDQVLKYAKSFITVDDVDSHYIPENDFAEGDETTGEHFEDEDTAPLVKWESLSVPKSPLPFAAEEDSTPAPKKAKTDEVSESSSSKLVPAESLSLHPCPLTNCTRQCSTRRDLLVHLAMAHYLKELEKQLGTGCSASRCAQCDMMLPTNKQGYLKHMAVEHEIVMSYVERDVAMELVLDKALESVCRFPLPGTVGDQSGDVDGVGKVIKKDAEAKK